jgi:hypothetical protein
VLRAIFRAIASRLSLRYRARASGRFVRTKVARYGPPPLGRRLLASPEARLLSRKFPTSAVLALALLLKVPRLLEHRKLLDESVCLMGSLKGSSSPRWRRLILTWRSARIQVTVVMKALISKTGEVESLELISGHPMLAPAALEAVKQRKYRPYMLNGNAVLVETQIKVNFALSSQE